MFHIDMRSASLAAKHSPLPLDAVAFDTGPASDIGLSALVEQKDWSQTPLGSQATWSAALRYAVCMCLASAFPMCIYWGSEFIQIYNDAAIPILGQRHPRALGQRVADCWPEIFEIIEPMLLQARDTGAPVFAADMAFMVERNGAPEEAFFTFSYSQLRDDDGAAGVLCAVNETTAQIRRQRDLLAMTDTVSNIVFALGPDGVVGWANKRWYEYTNLPPAIATTAEGWARVVQADDLTSILARLARAFATGEAYEAEIRIKPDGKADEAYRWFLLRSVPMHDTNGKLTGWVGSATDVHDRRVQEDAVREQLAREHEALKSFQLAALPQTLPNVAGLTFDAVYEPAQAEALVGGDWYDAFRIADGRVVLSVGDVSGSGLNAAITMAAVRQAIRGAVQLYPDPVAVLDAADRALRSEQPDRIVTAFVGVLDPLTRGLSYASAGHPFPLIQQPDGTLRELDGTDLPLGLRDDPRDRENGWIVLPDEALLVLYTDGLIEATRDILEGERRLRTAMASPSLLGCSHPAVMIRDTVLRCASRDDVAILTVRIAPLEATDELRRWSFAALDAHDGICVRKAIGQSLRDRGATPGEADDAELIFGELLGNAVRHAGGNVDVILDLTCAEPRLHVLDRGPGFSYYARLPQDTMSESGRGLFITSMLARDVSVVARPDGGSHARVLLLTRKNLRRSPATDQYSQRAR